MTTNWISVIDDSSGEPTIVYLENVIRFESTSQPDRVVVQTVSGHFFRIRCTMQDLTAFGGFPVAIIQAPMVENVIVTEGVADGAV